MQNPSWLTRAVQSRKARPSSRLQRQVEVVVVVDVVDVGVIVLVVAVVAIVDGVVFFL